MENNYIVQFEVCLNNEDDVKKVKEWIRQIQQYNHNVLRRDDPHHNPIITNDMIMKAFN